ncbi:MAG: hypothetical protein IKU03_04640, partial [Bacteroidales bacterium]|nr:hypothetical protein [Bacteroidales bacterium]
QTLTINGNQLTISGGNTITLPTGGSGTGQDGRGIQSITGPVTNGLQDTYTINYTDGSTSTFVVTNGAAGATGPQGPQGPAGATGATGPQGPQGETGATGATGPQGPQGPQGATGATGPQGPAGPQGPQGPQGPAGEGVAQTLTINGNQLTISGGNTITLPTGGSGTGQDGRGIQSITGPVTSGLQDTYTINYTDGSTSTFVVTNGATGAQGPQGATGATGPQGPQGPAGATGATGPQGPQGETGATGATGPQGPQGPAGPQGPQGPAGTGVPQTLAISGNQLSISDGNSVTLPQGFSGDYNDLINTPTIPTVNNATLTIQKNGSSVGTFTANASANKTINITVPTTTSDLTNNSGFITASQVPAQVNADWNATSGAAQILNKPTVPTVNNGTLTIQQNGTSLGTFTANQSSNQTVNIETPTTADLNYLMEYFNAQIAMVNANMQAFSQNLQDSMANMHQQYDSLQNALNEMQEIMNEDANFVCGVSKVKDYDGNVYNTVLIGSQCWMKENMRAQHFSDGTFISLGTDTSSTVAYRYDPGNNANYVATYGYLYNWVAVMHGSASSSANPSGVQGICPTGWHVPSNLEWTQLYNYVKSQSEYLCNGSSGNIGKALASTIGWNSSTTTCAVGNTPADNNATGFSAVPAGYRYNSFSGVGSYSYMWSATQYNSTQAYYRYLYASSTSMISSYGSKWYGRSVRCLRDALPLNVQVEQQQQQIDSLQNALNTLTSMVPNHYYVPSSGTKTVTLGSDVTSLMVYDYAGPGANYDNSWDGKLVLVTNRPNSIFKITGNFTTESISYDYLELYNGAGTVGNNRIIRLGGTGTIGTSTDYIYTSGDTLTIRFRSDGTTVKEGFALNISVITHQACPNRAVDVEGNFYTTVLIGDQCWMRKNLRTKKYANWDDITLKISDTSSTNYYRYNPNSDTGAVANYGYLYNWAAVMHGASGSNANPSGVQGICPSGWHVPSNAEWSQLRSYVMSQSSYLCNNNSTNIAKALAATTGWSSSTITCAVGNDLSANNATGFTALPAGELLSTGNFHGFGTNVWFWTSQGYSGTTSDYATDYGFISSGVTLSSNMHHKTYGNSVRCVRN